METGLSPALSRSLLSVPYADLPSVPNAVGSMVVLDAQKWVDMQDPEWYYRLKGLLILCTRYVLASC